MALDACTSSDLPIGCSFCQTAPESSFHADVNSPEIRKRFYIADADPSSNF